MTLKQRKQEGMALIWIVLIFLTEYQEIWGIKRFMTFFVVDTMFSLPAIFRKHDNYEKFNNLILFPHLSKLKLLFLQILLKLSFFTI